MSDKNSDRKLERLVLRSLVPRGLRPQTDDEIEKLLDTIGGEPISQEKFARMLRKFKGEEELFKTGAAIPSEVIAELNDAERELVELFRAGGKGLPPELRAKIEELERRASEDIENDNSDGE